MQKNTIIKELNNQKKLQAYINENQARFAPIFWPSLTSRVIENDNLRWDTLIGDRKAGVAGYVTAFDVSAPEHARDAMREKGGKIPSIRGKRVMKETDLRKYINLKKQNNPNINSILDLSYDDISFCSIAPHKRVDFFEARLLSTGKVSFTDADNVGAVTQFDVDFEIPSENQTGVSALWSDKDNSDPLLDLKNSFFVPLAEMGIFGGVIRMHPSKIFQMLESKKLLAKFGLLTQGQIDGIDMSLERLNAYLAKNQFATIRPFNASIGIEMDGKPAYSNPWEVNNVNWMPDVKPFTLHKASSMDEESPDPNLTYAHFMGALVKKWYTTDPKAEHTAYEFNAFPSLDIADELRIMDTGLVTG